VGAPKTLRCGDLGDLGGVKGEFPRAEFDILKKLDGFVFHGGHEPE
jgi:hypothetical protein